MDSSSGDGGKKRKRERKIRERGKRVFRDPEAEKYRRRFKNYGKGETGYAVVRYERQVPPSVQFWRKDLHHVYLMTLAHEKRKQDRFHAEHASTTENSDCDTTSDYEYPTNIADFRQLDELERINSKDFNRDMARYARDEKLSDGFDVGYYPCRDAAGICSGGFTFCHYKPPELNLPQPQLDTLLLLSHLAISVYNMHHVPATNYDNVQVLKAMKFGPFCTNFNLTFQASLPAVTFETRVFDRAYPPHSAHSSIEILLVRRKFRGGQDGSDYVGAQCVPSFPSNMEHISDFDEKDPQSYAIHTDSESKLPLYLSHFAIHKYNIDHRRRWDHDEDDEDDKIYDNVKVLSTLKTLDDEHGTTYFITFEASLIDTGKNSQIFETKVFMSPLIPTTKIKVKFVRIKPN